MKAKIFFGLFIGIPAFIGLAVAFQALPDWGKSAVQCVGMLLAVLLLLLIVTGGRAMGGDAGQQGGGGGYQPPRVSGGDPPGGCSGAAARAREATAAQLPYMETKAGKVELASRLFVLRGADLPPALPAGEEQIELRAPSPTEKVPHREH